MREVTSDSLSVGTSVLLCFLSVNNLQGEKKPQTTDVLDLNCKYKLAHFLIRLVGFFAIKL